MSEFLHFSEHGLQEIALGFMAIVYISRVYWYLHFKAGRERQAPSGSFPSTPTKGILYSWANIALPWAMESTRTRIPLYLQFVVFHLGVTAAIVASFLIPYAPQVFESEVVQVIFRGAVGGAFLVGVYRLGRRIFDRYIRAISSPDDYFSVILLTVWFAFAFLAIPNRSESGEWPLIAFFLVTGFFLIYVPFSKISHYLYYPFTRYYFGKSMGRRGVYPIGNVSSTKYPSK